MEEKNASGTSSDSDSDSDSDDGLQPSFHLIFLVHACFLQTSTYYERSV
jgi:hypothetical protein